LITDAISKVLCQNSVVCVIVSLGRRSWLCLKTMLVICVTTDGTDKTEQKELYRKQDLIAQASNPGVQIKRKLKVSMRQKI
jgi:hypothetical protein